MGGRRVIHVEVSRVIWDEQNKGPVVLLKDMNSDYVLPIWIGEPEAMAIVAALEHYEFKRPLTHDLMKEIIDSLDAKVLHVLISEIKDSTFYARIMLECNGSVAEIDARPSDSIALALRTGSPIYVAREVFEAGKAIPLRNFSGFENYGV